MKAESFDFEDEQSENGGERPTYLQMNKQILDGM